MQVDQLLKFGPYRLGPQTGQLWRGKQEIRLTGKTSAVLRALVERAGQMVTKEELFREVWPETAVSDAALTSCIQELRQALRDDARKPRYIETVHRRGFRFIGKVASSQHSVVSRKRVETESSSLPSQDSALRTQPSLLVGRETELAQLHGWLAKALSGERQIVFVTGEPGIGKTALVDTFLAEVGAGRRACPARESPQRIAPTPDVWVTSGQCIEHYGAGEAYLPVLEALGRLCREENGKDVIALLRQHAPTWLVQMPALLSATGLEELQRRTAGVTRERMLRELAEAVEGMTAEHMLILWFEDLHWSDVSTLDWLAAVARRREVARLLLICTYRPVEVLTREHPLKGIKQELQLHGQCVELALDFLTEENVAEYLAVRFSRGARRTAPLDQLAHIIHQRTDGNPLFMVTVTNELVAQGVAAKTDAGWEIREGVKEATLRTPVNLRQLIEQQLERVSPEERKILEAASVAEVEFSAAAVAAGTDKAVEEVEQYCEALMRREQFLCARGTAEWPDRTIAAHYGFLHALYQEVLYEQISPSRRIRLHHQIGERMEQGYGDQAREIAAELAVHFERGRDYHKAIQYLQHAGENAVRRSANVEAESHLTTGLKLLHTLPNTPMRTQQELALQLALGAVLTATKGVAASEVEQAYRRAQALCEQIGDREQVGTALYGLTNHYAMRADHQTACALADQLLSIAPEVQDPDLLIAAHRMLGSTRLWMGAFPAARFYLEQGIALYDRQQHRAHTFRYGHDLGVACRVLAAQVLWILGYPDHALTCAQEGLVLAQTFSHVNTLGYGLASPAQIHYLRGEWQAAQARAEAAVAFATEVGLPYFAAQQSILWGAALAAQGHYEEGITKMRYGLAAQRAISGRILQQLWLALQVEAYIETGQIEEGWTALEEALTIRPTHGDRYWEAELYRLKGMLLLAQDRRNPEVRGQRPSAAIAAEAEAFFRQAIDTARELSAKSLELRATTSLARLWQQQGRTKQDHKMLAEIYNWFTEGFDTKDLQEAKTLLEELKH